MTRYALVNPSDEIVRELLTDGDQTAIPTKAGWRWLPVAEEDADHDPDAEAQTATETTIEEARIVRARGKRALTVDDLKAYAAQQRYAKEVGGVAVGQSVIDTARDSQALISGAFNMVASGNASEIKFKGRNGWVTLDGSAMTAVAVVVGQHVQACFAKEAEVSAAIDAGTITSKSAIDAAFAEV